MTDAQTETTLRLAVLSPEYRYGSASGLASITNESEEDRTFYVTSEHPGVPPGWVTLIVPTSDPRHRGMWELGEGELGTTGPHRGWHVSAEWVTFVEDRPQRPALILSRVGTTDTHDDRMAPFRSLMPNGGPGRVIPDDSQPQVRVVTVTQAEYEELVGKVGTLRQVDTSDPFLTFFVTVDGRTVWVHDVELVEDTAPEEEREPYAFTLAEVREREEEARQQATREASERFERWKARANEIATTYANNNSLCGEFDRCMEEIGLPGRTRDYRVTFTMTVSARDSDDALDKAEDQATHAAWSDLGVVDVEEE